MFFWFLIKVKFKKNNAAVSPDAQFLPCAAYCQQCTSQRLTLQPTFTRRTSGRSLGNFTEVNFLFVPHSPDSLSLSVAIFKAYGITSAHCHSAARRKTTPDAANCYAERHHSHGTCCVYSAATTTFRNYHSSNTTKKTQADFKLLFLFLFVFPPSTRRPTQRNWPPRWWQSRRVYWCYVTK